MAKSIKISDENYQRLSNLSGKLRSKYHKPVSLNDAITYLYKRGKLSELSGKWNMSDTEAKEIKSGIKRGWKNWGTKSV